MKITKKNFSNFILAASFILFFIIGFYLNEDSAGGGKIDFVHEWKSFNEFRLFGLDALTSLNYESSRTPLFLLLNYFNIFAYNEYSFRFSNFIFNFIIIFAFFICTKNKKIFNYREIIILIGTLTLSPYFRTTSYWAHQENLPLLFLFLTIYFLDKFNYKIKKLTFNKIILVAILSSLSFYSDQKFIFISLVTFFILITDAKYNLNEKSKIFLIYTMTALPALYLFFLWGGIVPKQSQFRIGFYLKNISSSISIIFFYFLPCVFYLILKNKKKILQIPKTFFKDKNFFIFVSFAILNIFTIPDFDSSWGNGIIYKVIYILNNKVGINIILLKILYFIFLQITFLFVYNLLRLSYLKNFIPIFIIVILTALVETTYNEYFDPLIFTLIFLFFNFNKKIIEDKRKLVNVYLIFYIFLLAIANIYYKYFDLNAL